MDALATGRRITCLTCVDDFTKECLTVTAAFAIYQEFRSHVFWTVLRYIVAIRQRSEQIKDQIYLPGTGPVGL